MVSPICKDRRRHITTLMMMNISVRLENPQQLGAPSMFQGLQGCWFLFENGRPICQAIEFIYGGASAANSFWVQKLQRRTSWISRSFFFSKEDQSLISPMILTSHTCLAGRRICTMSTSHQAILLAQMDHLSHKLKCNYIKTKYCSN